ncbi:MAG TPA: Hpt domain-containing protein [Planctomycetaceae bacterium]|nr:Hpt domain-containing protein [Planctomycetaceae bacterium]
MPVEPLVSRFRDDLDFRELLEEFVAATPERTQAFTAAFAAGQLDEVRRQAHQLKGSGGGYGYDRLSEVAAELEHACKEPQPQIDTVAELLDRVLDHLQRVVV